MIIIVLSLNVVFKRANKKAAATGIPIEGLEGFRYVFLVVGLLETDTDWVTGTHLDAVD